MIGEQYQLSCFLSPNPCSSGFCIPVDLSELFSLFHYQFYNQSILSMAWLLLLLLFDLGFCYVTQAGLKITEELRLVSNSFSSRLSAFLVPEL